MDNPTAKEYGQIFVDYLTTNPAKDEPCITYPLTNKTLRGNLDTRHVENTARPLHALPMTCTSL